MVKGQGPCRIEGVAIVELHLAPSKTATHAGGASLEASFALVNGVGDRFGKGTFNTWSEETAAKINEAILSMESDIASVVFEGTTRGSALSSQPQLEDEVPGL